MGIMEKLVYLRGHPLLGRAARELLLVYGVDFPKEVSLGPELQLQHRGMGTVIHPLTKIGRGVTLYHQVTIGRADAHVPWQQSKMVGIEIGDGAVLYPGVKILGGPGVTRVGESAIIAANAVVTCSVPDNEIWGGVPAKKLSDRA
ncbi:hypothetical protein [Kineosporia sp. NBRC 101731]|uniref:serine O-acetyltransferase n=1 Tax=Kineosporia sp. NBRC 101731 TaxID=3032199 RepID=UPI0024A3FBF4|nr:hypothetical protein [Kineosporia sp. NBRC 101731]GLY29852.1 hypothetical protein Kisp02_32170 [Kineosporia sp. NBRC 101731]